MPTRRSWSAFSKTSSATLAASSASWWNSPVLRAVWRFLCSICRRRSRLPRSRRETASSSPSVAPIHSRSCQSEPYRPNRHARLPVSDASQTGSARGDASAAGLVGTHRRRSALDRLVKGAVVGLLRGDQLHACDGQLKFLGAGIRELLQPALRVAPLRECCCDVAHRPSDDGVMRCDPRGDFAPAVRRPTTTPLLPASPRRPSAVVPSLHPLRRWRAFEREAADSPVE